MEDATHEFDKLKGKVHQLEKENRALRRGEHQAANLHEEAQREYEKYKERYEEL